MLALVVATAAGGLTLADVKAGDFVEYSIDKQSTLRVSACAVSASTVTLAISLTLSKKTPARFPSVLDGMLIEQPVAPLSPPGKLPDPTELKTHEGWKECGEWKLPFSFHGVNGSTLRCAAPELILGGGLVSLDHSQFTIRGGGFSHDVRLAKHGNQKAASCPKWPRARVAGSWREVRSDGKTVERSVTSSGSWVREAGGDQYLFDLIVWLARKRVEQGPVTTSWLTFGELTRSTWLEKRDGALMHWPSLELDAPLEVRASPLRVERGKEVEELADWK